MSISGVDNNGYNVSFNGRLGNFANKAKQRFYDVFANRTVGERADKFYKWTGKKISSAENRLILGFSALLSQPFFDYFNRKQDEKTRLVSACRTVAKIIAGMTTGFLVRKGAIKLIQACSKMPAPNLSKWRTILTPKVKNINPDALEQYQNALGTYTALGAMIFTNFKVDAPVTMYLTNNFTDKAEKHIAKREMLAKANNEEMRGAA